MEVMPGGEDHTQLPARKIDTGGTSPVCLDLTCAPNSAVRVGTALSKISCHGSRAVGLYRVSWHALAQIYWERAAAVAGLRWSQFTLWCQDFLPPAVCDLLLADSSPQSLTPRLAGG